METEEERSLDLVQRVVFFSAIVVVVTGSIAATLAGYIAFNPDEFSRAETWLVLGLAPMAISAYWVLRGG